MMKFIVISVIEFDISNLGSYLIKQRYAMTVIIPIEIEVKQKDYYETNYSFNEST